MPENTRRSTLNQELIRRMVNTSEMVNIEHRVEVIDKYAQKLINSEYSVAQARKAVIEGLKGYERLLSLSKDKGNPRWKPLHLSAGWNKRNRRIAKQMSKTNWYKDKPEVEPPTDPRREEKMARFSIHKEDHSTLQEEPSSQQEDHSIREEDPGTSEAGRNHPNPE